MNKYIYTVSRIANGEDEGRVISIVKACIDAEEVAASCKTSSIRMTVKDGTDKDELERKLSYALIREGYELILPEGAATFIPASDCQIVSPSCRTDTVRFRRIIFSGASVSSHTICLRSHVTHVGSK